MKDDYCLDMVNVSPILYQGSKRRLLNKGLSNHFPNNIDTFYDLFSGSGIVSMNVKANNYVLNDVNRNLVDMYEAYKNNKATDIIEHIKNRIKEYGLPISSNEELKEYKDNYEKFREEYNSSKNVLDLITLVYYSFSQIIRFNGKGQFNMPLGNRTFSKEHEDSIKFGCNFFGSNNVSYSNKSFLDIDFSKIHKNDFVYLDPPYFNTTAVYNESNRLDGGWTIDDDTKMFEICENLDRNGIFFGISNVFKCKGKENTHLIKWCEKHNWKVVHFNLNYVACGKGNSEADEVYITNYKDDELDEFLE